VKATVLDGGENRPAPCQPHTTEEAGDQEKEEQHLAISTAARSDPAEPEYRGDDGNDKTMTTQLDSPE